MASVGTVTTYIGSSTPSYSGTLSTAYSTAARVSPVQTVKTTQSPARSLAHPDTVDLSQISKVLGQIELQLQRVSSTEFNQVLSSAADSVWAQAQQEDDSAQAEALANLASRLQVAANSSGLSALPPDLVAALIAG